jgi:hypothetical protein
MSFPRLALIATSQATAAESRMGLSASASMELARLDNLVAKPPDQGGSVHQDIHSNPRLDSSWAVRGSKASAAQEIFPARLPGTLVLRALPITTNFATGCLSER